MTASACAPTASVIATEASARRFRRSVAMTADGLRRSSAGTVDAPDHAVGESDRVDDGSLGRVDASDEVFAARVHIGDQNVARRLHSEVSVAYAPQNIVGGSLAGLGQEPDGEALADPGDRNGQLG